MREDWSRKKDSQGEENSLVEKGDSFKRPCGDAYK